MTPVKVLIVDDSALARDILRQGLSGDPEIEVIGAASDVYSARDQIVYKKPDVITLDVEMPRMDGLEFLKKLMPQYPIPVVMVSAMTEPGAKITLEALDHGAVDFVLKPASSFGHQLQDMIDELRTKVKSAAKVDVSAWRNLFYKSGKKTVSKSKSILVGGTDKVLAIGASTGGTIALRQMITSFPANMVGTVVVQHMPPTFTKLFAEKLNEISSVEVREAVSGDRVLTGQVLIAPGGFQMEIVRSGGTYIVRCKEGEKVNGHCPSVDVLFHSVADHVGSNALGVLLTGMGRDGAAGMLAMRKAGARTLAQDEATSVVFGMPKEAYINGGAEKLVPLGAMVDAVVSLLKELKP